MITLKYLSIVHSNLMALLEMSGSIDILWNNNNNNKYDNNKNPAFVKSLNLCCIHDLCLN